MPVRMVTSASVSCVEDLLARDIDKISNTQINEQKSDSWDRDACKDAMRQRRVPECACHVATRCV